MLSDEEKYAIDYLKIYIERDVMYENRHYKQIETILNLIEKQSKEIEELKEKDDANLAYYDQIYQNGIYTGQKALEEKIKAKIEYYEKIDNPVGKRVLESLLEKE